MVTPAVAVDARRAAKVGEHHHEGRFQLSGVGKVDKQAGEGGVEPWEKALLELGKDGVVMVPAGVGDGGESPSGGDHFPGGETAEPERVGSVTRNVVGPQIEDSAEIEHGSLNRVVFLPKISRPSRAEGLVEMVADLKIGRHPRAFPEGSRDERTVRWLHSARNEATARHQLGVGHTVRRGFGLETPRD